MGDRTPDLPTEELIWFAWPPQPPRTAAHVEADQEAADLIGPVTAEEPPPDQEESG